MEKISVIVPVYKVEDYLERCVCSICRQTYENLEIILVDDGSPDACGRMCDSFAAIDSRIKVIHKINGGLSDARNAGIEALTGESVVFVDSDDWLDPDMIELLHRMKQEYKADIVECSYRNIYKDRIEEETTCSAEIVEGDSQFALEGMLDWRYFKPIAWNKLYNRQSLGNVRFPKGKLHEDEFTTYQYFWNAEKLVYVDVSKYNYDRTRDDSITGGQFRENNLDACWAFRERVDFFYKNQVKAELQRKMNNIYCWYVLECLYKCYKHKIHGDKVKALQKQIRWDIGFFSNQSVNKKYIRELEIIKDKGLKKYGKLRADDEKKKCFEQGEHSSSDL